MPIGQRVAVEPVVDVDDDNPGVRRLLGDADQRLGVGRREDDGVHAPRDHLIDDRDLTRDILFVLDACRDQFVLLGVSRLVRPRPLFHRLKELVRQRFHHQRDHGPTRRLRITATASGNAGARNEGAGHDASSGYTHAVSPSEGGQRAGAGPDEPRTISAVSRTTRRTGRCGSLMRAMSNRAAVAPMS